MATPSKQSAAGPIHRAAEIIEGQVLSGRLEAAILHVQKGADSHLQYFGKAASGDAIFLLASITKPMTATAVMRLVDQGELHLSDPVKRFIPAFADGARKDVRVLHLLNHTSGLPDQLPENNALRRRHAPLSEFVEHAVRTPLLFAPGERYSYQSMGILLAAEIVQRITQMSLPKYLEREVFPPLHMSNTVLGMGTLQMQDVVRSQTEAAAPESGAGAAAAKNWDWNSRYWRELGAPWGGAHGSAPDVTRFLRSFLHPDGRVLKPDTARTMIRSHTAGKGVERGLGFAVGPTGFGQGCSAKTFGHSGSTGTLAWADPEKDLTCVILTSLPARLSGSTILRPVSDVISTARF